MNVMVTGNQGYVGSVLTHKLIESNFDVIGYDVGYFAENSVNKYRENFNTIKKDIRNVELDDFTNIDAVIHLAGLSNDPLGEFSPKLTNKINCKGTINFAKVAKKAHVKRFIYASSQSMYGISRTDEELDEYNSEKNPQTAYARAKWEAEEELNLMCDNDFIVTSFRPSTVFGASPRLRCDIVYNNLIASAYTTGKIEIKSDGSPWRPVVHIKDVCEAFMAGLLAPSSIINGKAFNVGIPNGNYTVKDLAEAARKVVPNSEIIYTGEHTDARTYKVCFNRILNELRDYYKPSWTLDMGGNELIDMFKKYDFNESHFRGRETIRLKQLLYLIDSKKIDKDLYSYNHLA